MGRPSRSSTNRSTSNTSAPLPVSMATASVRWVPPAGMAPVGMSWMPTSAVAPSPTAADLLAGSNVVFDACTEYSPATSPLTVAMPSAAVVAIPRITPPSITFTVAWAIGESLTSTTFTLRRAVPAGAVSAGVLAVQLVDGRIHATAATAATGHRCRRCRRCRHSHRCRRCRRVPGAGAHMHAENVPSLLQVCTPSLAAETRT